MTPQIHDTLRACTEGSDAGTMTFPQVVARLNEAGIERYHADLVRSEKTYFSVDDAACTLACRKLDQTPAQDFVAAGVEAAIRSVQSGAIDYKEFCRRIAQAGCVFYLVSLAGQRAVYYGRSGEAHVEMFPGAR